MPGHCLGVVCQTLPVLLRCIATLATQLSHKETDAHLLRRVGYQCASQRQQHNSVTRRDVPLPHHNASNTTPSRGERYAPAAPSWLSACASLRTRLCVAPRLGRGGRQCTPPAPQAQPPQTPVACFSSNPFVVRERPAPQTQPLQTDVYCWECTCSRRSAIWAKYGVRERERERRSAIWAQCGVSS